MGRSTIKEKDNVTAGTKEDEMMTRKMVKDRQAGRQAEKGTRKEKCLNPKAVKGC